MAFFICFASCLILGNADNQQGRGVKCIINYWEGATSLLELILMLLLPLWVIWGVKYFSRDRGAAPQHSFAYQINSRAWWRCQPRQLRYTECKRGCTCLWKVPLKSVECFVWYRSWWHSVWGGSGLHVALFQMVSLTCRKRHIWFDAWRINMVININLTTEYNYRRENSD